jgi:hypothetical protein
VVVNKFGIGSSDDQNANACVSECKQLRLGSDCPTFASSSCYAPPKAICVLSAARKIFCFSLG